MKLTFQAACLSYGAAGRASVTLPVTLREHLRNTDSPYASMPSFVGKCVAKGEVILESSLTVDADFLSKKYIILYIQAVIGHCKLDLNGTEIAEICDTGMKKAIRVHSLLREGENVLRLRFLPNGEMEDAGICVSPVLEGSDVCPIASVGVRPVFSDAKDRVTLHLSVYAPFGLCSMDGVATLVSPVGKIYYAGIHAGSAALVVPDPMLWYPAIYGTPALYRLTVTEYAEDRAVQSHEEPLLISGVSLWPEVLTCVVGQQRRPLHAAMLTPPLCADARTERLWVDTAGRMGLGMLYIPSNAALLSETFYHSCMKQGLLISLGVPMPRAEESCDAYTARVRALLRPVMQCGAVCAVVLPKGVAPASEVCSMLRALMAVEFPTVPLRSLGREGEGLMDLSEAPLSLPTPRTLGELLASMEENLYSRGVETLFGSEQALVRMCGQMAEEYPYATDLAQLSYVSELFAAAVLEQGILSVRAHGNARGVLLPPLGDPLPALSAVALDCAGRQRLAVHVLRRAMAPVALYAEASDGMLILTLSSYMRTEYYGTLSLRVSDAANGVLWTKTLSVKVSDGAAAEVLRIPIEELTGGCPYDRYLFAEVSDGGVADAALTHLFCKPKHFAFLPPGLRYEISGAGHDFELTLFPQAFAYRVSLSFVGTDAVFEDNVFDLVRNMPKRVAFRTASATTAAHLYRELNIQCLFTVGRAKYAPFCTEKKEDPVS